MLMVTLYAEQKKRHRFIEQSKMFLSSKLESLLSDKNISSPIYSSTFYF